MMKIPLFLGVRKNLNFKKRRDTRRLSVIFSLKVRRDQVSREERKIVINSFNCS